LSHSNTFVLLVQDEKILKYYKLPFGGKIANEYLLNLISNKFAEHNLKIGPKEGEQIIKYLKVALNYKEDVMKVYNNILNGETDNFIISKNIKQPNLEDLNQRKIKNIVRKTKGENNNEEVKEEPPLIDIPDKEVVIEKENMINDEEIFSSENLDENIIEEDIKEDLNPTENMTEREKIYYYLDKDETGLSQSEIKNKRKYRMIYFSTLYRFKQRVEKEIRKMIINIEHLEEEFDKKRDINKYIIKIRERYDRVKKRFKKT